MLKLTSFTHNGKSLPVRYVETQQVKDGVECDIYVFTEDTSRDLAIVRVKGGSKTPLQRVLKGKETIEGFLDGQATLTTVLGNNTPKVEYFSAPKDVGREVVVRVGQIVQWQAMPVGLTFYEICEPPYEDGRFENLLEPAK